jgi:hypothetical protein
MAFIRAGTLDDLNTNTGEWLVLDIGFANKASSCGLLINGELAKNIRFNDAIENICSFIYDSGQPVNLVIEAPLSVAFDRLGNPVGRRIEKQGSKTRYWYVGLGCSVMVAAMYLVRAISELKTITEVRLFEGFVSFKDKGVRSNHIRDVELIWNVIKNKSSLGEIFSHEDLCINQSDRLQSAFLVSGLDLGIPPVIKC